MEKKDDNIFTIMLHISIRVGLGGKAVGIIESMGNPKHKDLNSQKHITATLG